MASCSFVLGITILGQVQQRFGLFVSRTISGILTTVGLCLFIFYEENPYLMYPGMAFSKFSLLIISLKSIFNTVNLKYFHSCDSRATVFDFKYVYLPTFPEMVSCFGGIFYRRF